MWRLKNKINVSGTKNWTEMQSHKRSWKWRPVVLCFRNRQWLPRARLLCVNKDQRKGTQARRLESGVTGIQYLGRNFSIPLAASFSFFNYRLQLFSTHSHLKAPVSAVFIIHSFYFPSHTATLLLNVHFAFLWKTHSDLYWYPSGAGTSRWHYKDSGSSCWM